MQGCTPGITSCWTGSIGGWRDWRRGGGREGAISGPGRIRRTGWREGVLRGVRTGGADRAPDADLVDHPFPVLEDAGALSIPPLPDGDLLRAGQWALGSPDRTSRLR